MTCAAAWLQGVVMERKRAAEAGERDGAKLIIAVDEAWRITANLGVAEWLQSSFKLCRANGVQNIIAMHRLSDLGAAGAAGSRESRIAEGLISDADTRVVLAQPHDQLDGLRSRLGLTATETELVPTLRRGEALWQVGRRSFLVQHRLSSDRAGAGGHRRPDGAPPRSEAGRVSAAALILAAVLGARRPWRPPARSAHRARRRAARAGRNRPVGAQARPTFAAGCPGPQPGRLILGRHGRRLIAAEDRASVVVVGPSTVSLKTTGFAIPALLEWEGPVVATSVKSDLLLDDDQDARAAKGKIDGLRPDAERPASSR